MSTKYSVGLMNQVGDAFEKAGYTDGDVNGLRSNQDVLEQFKAVLKGTAEIKFIPHIIDCDAEPFVPDGWTVEEHKKQGQFEYTKIELHLSEKQKKGSIKGNELRKELEDKPALNANVLDYLLAHPELIPEDWKSKHVFFWGTIYLYSSGNLCVRYLDWRGAGWDWNYDWLDNDWRDLYPAVLASK